MSSARSPTVIDLDKQALMNGGSPRIGAGSLKSAKVEEVSTREQVLPILAYCAASITMTVVNSTFARGLDGLSGALADSRQSSSCQVLSSL